MWKTTQWFVDMVKTSVFGGSRGSEKREVVGATMAAML